MREIIQEEVSDFNSKMSAPPDDITGEPDEEGAMARSQLLKLAKYSAALMDMMNDNTQLPAWVQAKITKSASYLGAVKHFIEGELELNEDKQQMKISKQKLERIIREEVLKEMGMQMGEDDDEEQGLTNDFDTKTIAAIRDALRKAFADPNIALYLAKQVVIQDLRIGKYIVHLPFDVDFLEPDKREQIRTVAYDAANTVNKREVEVEIASGDETEEFKKDSRESY